MKRITGFDRAIVGISKNLNGCCLVYDLDYIRELIHKTYKIDMMDTEDYFFNTVYPRYYGESAPVLIKLMSQQQALDYDDEIISI